MSRSRSRSRSGSGSSGYGVGLGEKVENAERCGELEFDASTQESEFGGMEGKVYVLGLVQVELLGVNGWD